MPVARRVSEKVGAYEQSNLRGADVALRCSPASAESKRAPWFLPTTSWRFTRFLHAQFSVFADEWSKRFVCALGQLTRVKLRRRLGRAECSKSFRTGAAGG